MLTPRQVAETTIKTIAGSKANNTKIVNINGKHMSRRGDMSFQLGIDYWRGYLDTETNWFRDSENILSYFMHKFSLNKQNSALNDDENNRHLLEILRKQIIKELEQIYNISNLNPQLTFNISHNFALINFNRSILSYIAIKTAIEQGFQFGKKQNYKQNFQLKVEFDDESEITNLRLNLLKNVSLNLLKSQNCGNYNEECKNNYIFTIKSQSSIDKGWNRYLCGAVVNNSKKKESVWTQDMYFQRKLKIIKELNAQKYSDVHMDEKSIETDARKLVSAAISYELLSVKHSSPVIIDNSDKLENPVKEATFILYNNVRINSILDKYIKSVEKENFPKIIPIEKLELFNKITDEESWSLIYNYIIKYPDVLKAAVKIEPKLDINIRLLLSFVCNLCHDFSKYYRKNKILMRGINANEKMVLIMTERLHMLKALQIVLRNSLSLLDIDELEYM